MLQILGYGVMVTRKTLTLVLLVRVQLPQPTKEYAGLAQQGEHMPYKHRVGGSSPSLRTIWWFSSAGRAFALQARGRRFEPVNHHQRQVGTLHLASLPFLENCFLEEVVYCQKKSSLMKVHK